MFIHYQGDDVRQGGPMKELEYSLLQGTEKSYYSLEADKFKATQMKRITAFMEKIYYVNPDLEAILLPDSQFIPYSHINVSKYTIPRRSSKKKTIKIIHAPSNRGLKGTEIILSTIKRIRITNPRVKFELIENLPHELALQKYREADLLIDQMLGGWYGGTVLRIDCLRAQS
jgi:hypothetical protein